MNNVSHLNDGITTLIENKHQLRWMFADQTVEFDVYMRPPIFHRSQFVSAMRSFYEYNETVPPETLTTVVNSKLREVLVQISSKGEDLDRLACWLLAMMDTENTPVHRELLRRTWQQGFRYWVRNGLPKSIRTRLPEAAEIVRSYSLNVIEPKNEFFSLVRKSHKNWLSDETHRSSYDNYLFDVFYRDIGSSPVESFSMKYVTILQRKWFEKYQYEFSEEAYLELYNILVSLAYDGKSLDSSPRYVKVAPIHESFALNCGCSFQKYCRK